MVNKTRVVIHYFVKYHVINYNDDYNDVSIVNCRGRIRLAILLYIGFNVKYSYFLVI